MKIDYISDLHMGFVLDGKRSNPAKVNAKIKEFVESTLPSTLGDCLVVAGDIDEYNAVSLITLEEYAKHYSKVFFVFGNHDLYILSNKQQHKYKRNSYTRQEELKQMISTSPYKDSIRVLDNETVYYKGLTLAGTSLWYTLPLQYDQMWWESHSNDSRYIFPKGVTANEERSKRDVEFYQTLESEGVDVLITHVPPLHLNETHTPSASYHNVAISQLGLHVKHWVCGHQHVRTVSKVNDTTIYVNAGGYTGEFSEPPKIRSFEV